MKRISEVFCFERRLARDELHWMRDARSEMLRIVRAEAVRKLAAHLEQQCEFVNMADIDRMFGGEAFRIELTINDRGAYERALPSERRIARADGFADAQRKLPHGMEPVLDFYVD